MSTHHHLGLTSFWNTRSGPFKLPLPLGTLQRLPPNCLDGQSSIPRDCASRERNHTPLLLQPSATGAALNFVLKSETPFGFCGIVCGNAELKILFFKFLQLRSYLERRVGPSVAVVIRRRRGRRRRRPRQRRSSARRIGTRKPRHPPGENPYRHFGRSSGLAKYDVINFQSSCQSVAS